MQFWLALLLGVSYASIMLAVSMYVAYKSTTQRLRRSMYLMSVNGKPYHLWGDPFPSFVMTFLVTMSATIPTWASGGTFGETLTTAIGSLVTYCVGMTISRARYMLKYQSRVHPLAMSVSR